jgi:hypothetical protein
MVLVLTPASDSQNFLQNIWNKISSVFQKIFQSIKFATKKIQWSTQFTFDKLKWIPIGALIAIITTLFKHPLEFITRVLCAIIVSIIFVLYIITTIPPFSWIAFAVWFIIRYVLILIGFTVVSVAVFCIVALLFLLLAFVNACSGNKLNNLTLCQTSPMAWFTIPNYQDGNKYERGFFCSTPCSVGYSPDELSGSFCNRMPLAQPSFCPQAEIGERHVYANFIPTPAHFSKPPREKEEDYIKHFDGMQKFFNKCTQKMGGFNNIALDICGSLDAIKELKINLLDDKTIKKLKEVCKQGFCNSRSRHVFCSSFADSLPEKERSEIIKSVIFLTAAFILFVFLLVMTYKFVSASTK